MMLLWCSKSFVVGLCFCCSMVSERLDDGLRLHGTEQHFLSRSLYITPLSWLSWLAGRELSRGLTPPPRPRPNAFNFHRLSGSVPPQLTDARRTSRFPQLALSARSEPETKVDMNHNRIQQWNRGWPGQTLI